MRILHTADWHLGRVLHGARLIDDQAHILDQIVRIAEESRPDVVLIAGDLYDRAVPPPDAVELMDDTLSRLVLGLDIPVVAIAGNHDSPQRTAFGSRILGRQRLHVAGPFGPPEPVVLDDRHGPITIWPIPYADPPTARLALEDEAIATHDHAMTAACAGLAGRGGDCRTVLMAHAFVQGGAECESERPLSVGGSGAVSGVQFAGFSYVALGHLHRPQAAGRDAVRYSGSPLKYSFSEADHRKSVSLVEINAAGIATVEDIALSPRRDLRILEGTIAELTRGGLQGAREDYLSVLLTDEGAVYDAMARLRQIYPNVLHVGRSFLRRPLGEAPAATSHRRLGPVDHFAAFFAFVEGQELSEAQRRVVEDTVEGLEQADREVA